MQSKSTKKKSRSLTKRKSFKRIPKANHMLKRSISKYDSHTFHTKQGVHIQRITFASYCILCVKGMLHIESFKNKMGISESAVQLILQKLKTTSEKEINQIIQQKNDSYDSFMRKTRQLKGGDHRMQRICEKNQNEDGDFYDFIQMQPLTNGYQKIGRYCYNKDTIKGILNVNHGRFVDPYTRETYSIEDSKRIARKSGIGWKRIWEPIDQIHVYRNEEDMREHVHEVTESIFTNPRYQFAFFHVIRWLLVDLEQPVILNIFLLLNSVLAYRANLVGSNTALAFTFFQSLFLCGLYPEECGEVLNILDIVFEMLSWFNS